jgi:glycosyltransferase involved in cell wall biosynthesis
MHSNSPSNKPLKLFVVRPLLGQGGADRVTLTLLRSLDRKLFAPSLVLFRQAGEYIDDLPSDVKLYSLNVSSSWTAWIRLIPLLRQHKPDIVFSTSSGTNLDVVLAHRLSNQRGRLVISERTIVSRTHGSIKRKLMLLLKRWLYDKADVITTVSQCAKKDMVDQYGIHPHRITVVYSPVETTSIKQLGLEQVEHPWFNENIPIVLAAGRLVWQKDYFTLIKAFKVLREQRRARLVILGDGTLRSNLTKLVQEIGLEDDILMPGFDKNPFKYMSRCTMFVSSSVQEGLANVLIQAMACGAPVLSTDCKCGPSEVIDQPGINGFLVPVGSIEMLADKMMYLLDNPEIRKQVGNAGRQSAERFSGKVAMQYYVEALLNS